MCCRQLLYVIVLCLLCSSALVIEGIAIEHADISLTAGYRSDRLEWSIADTDGSPNILSELSWKDIEVFQVTGQAEIETGPIPYLDKNSLFTTRLSVGTIFAGEVRDSDYSGNNRTNEWSRSVSQTDSGFVVDLVGGWGPRFKFTGLENFILTPLVGYGFHMQELTLTAGQQVISEPSLSSSTEKAPHPQGPIAGLDSTYTVYWYGPWFGLQGDYSLSHKFVLKAGIEYHMVNLFAEADWNLRSDFQHPVSFEHDARGTGLVWNLACEYQLDQRWSLLFSGRIQDWKTDSGTDRTYHSDGRKSVTRLNRVEWRSYELMSGLRFRF